MHVNRRETAVHAARRYVEKDTTIFCPRHSADNCSVVPRETHDDVRIALRFILLAHEAERHGAGNVAVAAVDEGRTDLTARLQKSHDLGYRLGVGGRNVKIIADDVGG